MTNNLQSILEFKNYFTKLDYKCQKVDDNIYYFYKLNSSILVKIAFCWTRHELDLSDTLYDLFDDRLPTVDEKQLWIYENRYKNFKKYTIKGNADTIKLIDKS